MARATARAADAATSTAARARDAAAAYGAAAERVVVTLLRTGAARRLQATARRRADMRCAKAKLGALREAKLAAEKEALRLLQRAEYRRRRAAERMEPLIAELGTAMDSVEGKLKAAAQKVRVVFLCSLSF